MKTICLVIVTQKKGRVNKIMTTKYIIECYRCGKWIPCDKSYKTKKAAEKNLERIKMGRIVGYTRLVRADCEVIGLV